MRNRFSFRNIILSVLVGLVLAFGVLTLSQLTGGSAMAGCNQGGAPCPPDDLP